MRLAFSAIAALLLLAAGNAQAADEYRLLQMDGRIVKWGGPRLGEGASVTYAFTRARLDFPDNRNCRSVGPAAALMASLNVDQAAFEALVDQSFDDWRAVANVDFRKIDNAAAADILIGADDSGDGWAFADVRPGLRFGSVAPIHRAVVCMNAGRAWKIGFGGERNAQDFRYTLTHEIGHALGLNHAGPHGQLMSFTYTEAHRGLQRGDIEGVRALYGPPPIVSVTFRQTDAGAP